MTDDLLLKTEEAVAYPPSDYFYREFDFQVALEWSLVLNALSIEHILRKENHNWSLIISLELLNRGETEIEIYEKEKLFYAIPPVPIEYFPIDKPLIVVFFTLLLAFHIFVNWTDSPKFYNIGELSTQKVLNGEWWRAITALTLHADFQHFAMNAVFGITFITVLSYLTGTQFAISLTIISGFYGNLISSFMHKFDYSAIGFSTAVFGSLGLIVGMQMFGKYHLKTSSQRIVVLSSLLFFALFGIGGERVDVGAHILGLITGIIIGAVTSFWDLVRYKGFNLFRQILFVGIMLSLVICWVIPNL